MSTNNTEKAGLKGADRVIKQIEANLPNYTEAFLDTHPLNNSQINRLIDAVKKNPYLTYLNVFDCRLNPEQLKTLTEANLNVEVLAETELTPKNGF